MTPFSGIPNLFTDTVKDANGQVLNLMAYLQPDYLTKAYPAFLFYNGAGEDSGGVAKMDVWGPLAEVVSANFRPTKFNLIAVQAMGWDSNQGSVYQNLKKAYNISKVIVIGISKGGWRSVIALVPGNPIEADCVAYIAMSSQADASVYVPAAKAIAALKIPVFGSGDVAGDIHGVDTLGFCNAVTADGGNATFLNTPGTGHGGWNVLCSPTNKTGNGVDIYTWGMSFVPGPVVAPPPVVTPPPTITGLNYSDGTKYTPSHPIKSVVINYSDGTASETKS